MKRLILALAGVAAFTGQALAADMAVKAPPLVAPPISWTGFYVGINGGGAWTDDPSMTYVDLANTGTTFNSYNPTTVNASSSGGLAGFHAGYNWQGGPHWLLGVEGDWDWADLNASGTNLLTRALVGTVFTDNASLATKVDWLASVRGRLGYVWNNQLMFYATGGVAFADMKFSAAVNCTNVAPSFCGGGAQSINTQFRDTRTGAVFGAGMEFKFASHWILGAEYLHYDFHDSNTAGGSWFVVATGAPAPFFECRVAGQNCARFTFGSMGIDTGRVRLSYQFQP